MAGDLSKTDKVHTLFPEEIEKKIWSFPVSDLFFVGRAATSFDSGKLIFNARAESVLKKKMFRESVLRRRLVIPAAEIYEWNWKKEKVTFTSAVKEQSILYMDCLNN